MATPTTYTYSIQNDFPNHVVATDRLSLEISTSSIVIALNYINTSGDNCYIVFKDELSVEDHLTLDALVSAHTGESLPQNATVVEISDAQTPIPISNLASSGFYPDPSSYPIESLPPITDASGNQQIRGPVFTDEGSFRDDFGSDINKKLTGTVLFTNGSNIITGINTLFRIELNTHNYIKYVNDGYDKLKLITSVLSNTELELEEPYDGYTGYGDCYKTFWGQSVTMDSSLNVLDSILELKSGSTPYGFVSIFRMCDYLPLKMTALFSISQRVLMQGASLGFSDDSYSGLTSNDLACFYFDGYDNTKITCSTTCDKHAERSTVLLPSGLTTDDFLFYEIEIAYFHVSFLVNHILIARHERHIPKPYTPLYLTSAIWNLGYIQPQTITQIENISISNHNQIQIGGSYLSGEPISTRTSENCFILTGMLETESTDVDQVIISTTVPTNKMMFITGYCISSVLNSVDANPIKIGKNNMENEPAAPGEVNGNFFRIFRLESGLLNSEDFSANPRYIGSSGDIIKITVSPTGSLKTKWRATLDYVIR